ncbi:hypothetical protein HZH66_003938 [Vespula vulgaris]|uniref:Uncharacterized protein n=1 Tax=Vespula vulgaris TaxID=7454 RepID=A0A834NDA1_VESVU|nr:hypothetical protein HZH66_003938 [Vespula vulgaris]
MFIIIRGLDVLWVTFETYSQPSDIVTPGQSSIVYKCSDTKQGQYGHNSQIYTLRKNSFEFLRQILPFKNSCEGSRCILSLRKRYSSIPHGASPLPVRVQEEEEEEEEEEKAKKRKKRNGEAR